MSALLDICPLHEVYLSPPALGFYGAFSNGPNISLCMELMDGSLDIVLERVGRMEERWVGRVAVAVVKGLAYLKEEFNILHRGTSLCHVRQFSVY